MTSPAIERRGFPRHTVPYPVYASLESRSIGIVYDLSEGGIAIILFGSAEIGTAASVGFRFPGTNKMFSAECRIVWKEDASMRLGACFLDLPVASRYQIREWLSAQPVAPIHSVAPSQQPIPRPSVLSLVPPKTEEPSAPTPASEFDQPSRALSLGQGIALVVAALLMIGSLIYGGILAYGRRNSRRPNYTIPVPNPPRRTTLQPKASSATEPEPLSEGPVVLQVAAFMREDDASQLVTKLLAMGFPAFLVPPGEDHFYRVQVGPYANREAASKPKRDLEDAHYTVLVKKR